MDALSEALVAEGEGVLTLTLGRSFHLTIDGDIRIFLNRVVGGEVRLTIIAPKEVPIQRSNAKRIPGVL